MAQPGKMLLILLVAGLFSAAFNPGSVSARRAAPQAANIQVTDARVTYTFGETALFQAKIQSDAPLKVVWLAYQPEGRGTSLDPIEMSGTGDLALTLDLRAKPLRPFARVYYWLQGTLASGESFTSPSFWFDYIDNRFAWQTQESGDFQINWVDGGAGFGQTALNTAQAGMEAIQNLLPLPPPTKTIRIFIYNSAKDLQGALELGGQNWVSGHAHPDLGVAMVSIAVGPEQKLEMEQQIPHELAHVMLYQVTGENYGNLPAWLSEGFASIVELYPNPDYARALEWAKTNNSLLPLSDLCVEFPRNASGAFQAYAESASFLRYINSHFGSSGVQGLIQAYLQGYGCSEGVQAALGQPLSTLETAWREEALGMNVAQVAWRGLLPYLALFGVVLAAPLVPAVVLRRSRKVKSSE